MARNAEAGGRRAVVSAITQQALMENIKAFVRYLTDLWDVTITNPRENEALVYDEALGEWVNKSAYMRWLGGQVVGADYLRNDVIRNGNILAIANVDTSDSAALGVLDDQQWIHDEVPTWTTGTLSASSITTHLLFDVSDFAYTDRLRYWVSSASADIHYRFTITDDTDPAHPINQVADDIVGSDNGIGWRTVAIASKILEPGKTYVLTVDSWNSSGSSTTNLNYNYTRPNNADVPLPGDIVHSNKSLTSLYINKIDDDGGDNSTFLEGLAAGDHITGAGMAWTLTGSIVDNGTWMDYEVTPATQGTIGVASFAFEHFTAQPIPYAYLPAYFDTHTHPELSNLAGAVEVTGAISQEFTSDSYGIGIETIGVNKSPDWDWMATLYLDAAVSSAAVAASFDGPIPMASAVQVPYFSISHVKPYEYEGVDLTGTILSHWNRLTLHEHGGVDWGPTGDNRATMPDSGEYNLHLSAVVEDGNNVNVSFSFIKNGYTVVASSSIEVNVGVQSQVVIDTPVSLIKGDEIHVEVSTDVTAGADVIIHSCDVSVRQQWVQ